jgi:hypothetical protein
MRGFRPLLFAACVAALAASGCGRDQPADAATKSTAAAAPKKVVEEKPAPYTYPAPVKGHYKETNVGEFDVVDGIAWPAAGGAGTVVWVSSKPVASPLIAGSACPMTQARALNALRDGSYLEVTLDANAKSKYFAAGRAFGGSSREMASAGSGWSAKVATDNGRAVGSVVERRYGSFEFDLPLSAPKVNEVSESDRSDGRRGDPAAPKPEQQAVTKVYSAMHDAALKKNLKALLAAQGFDAKQIAAIRGLDSIDADFAVFADRFLTPGTPDDFTAKPGTAYVRTEGTNSKGKKFANYYHFAPCGESFVLVSIAENPQ